VKKNGDDHGTKYSSQEISNRRAAARIDGLRWSRSVRQNHHGAQPATYVRMNATTKPPFARVLKIRKQPRERFPLE